MKVNIGKPERVRPNRCLRCGHRLDARTKAGEVGQKGGDVSLCGYCGNVAMFTDDLRLREPTAEEHAVIEGDAGLKALIEQIKQRRRK